MSLQTENGKPTLDILIPVLNEEDCLRASVETLVEFMRAAMSGEYGWRGAIVDNDSDDDTPAIGAALAESDPGVECVRKVSAILLAGYWRLKRERLANGRAGRTWARRPRFLRRRAKDGDG